MARNEEKSHSMLNRWLEHKRNEETPGRGTKRPGMTSDVNSIDECEKWRAQILKEIGRKVNEIQNSSLPEKKIRDLNDEINKSLREKARWERRILDLGGPNYFAQANAVREEVGGGQSVGGGKGEYKYFGEAKNLAEVKELFKQRSAFSELEKKQKRAHELHKGLDADYYGFCDDDDGVLEPLEQQQEKKLFAKLQRDWQRENPTRDAAANVSPDEFAASLNTREVLAQIALPSREEIEQQLLEKRKEELLRKYTTQDSLTTIMETDEKRP